MKNTLVPHWAKSLARLRSTFVLSAALLCLLSVMAPAWAGAVRNVASFSTGMLPPNDDGSSSQVDIGFPVNFFGQTYSSVYVNNNGNITFVSPSSQFTPSGIPSVTQPLIAAFFADVDTRNTNSNVVTYGSGRVDGRNAFGVNYINVGYYSSKADKLNSFQLILISRPDCGTGDFDIEFNYNQIQWETGDASGGVNGLGGTSAGAGYTNGSRMAGTFYELPGSRNNGAFLDTNPSTGLIYRNNQSSIPGRYRFYVRNGGVTSEDTVAPDNISFTTPRDGGFVSDLSTITGTADDCLSGVARVDLFIRRDSDNLYWDGSAFTSTTPVVLPTTYNITTRIWTANGNGTTRPGLPARADLSEGSYTLTATAFDAAGNSASGTAVVRADRTGPIVTFTTPVEGGNLAGVTSINGTITDPNGSGPRFVQLFIFRERDQTYWNGSGWVSTPTPLATSLVGEQWRRDGGLPQDSDLTAGAYTLTARGEDNAANQTSTTISVFVDRTAPPIVTVDVPAYNSSVNSLPVISGMAKDEIGGSGIKRVDAFLLRTSDSKYWNGSAWVDERAVLATRLSGDRWAVTDPLPAGADLLEVGYRAGAAAYDRGDNVNNAFTVFRVDKTLSIVTIKTPPANAILPAFGPVNGTASDPTSGGAITRVDLKLQRAIDGKWWDGTQWVAAPNADLAPALSTIYDAARKTWASSVELLPRGADVSNGKYVFRAFAFDLANNVAVATNVVLIATPLTLSIRPTTFSEAASVTGAPAATGTVGRSGDLRAALTVSLRSADTTEARVPASVVIPAGRASATFPVTAVDDVAADGAQRVLLTAAASRYTSAQATIVVADNDPRRLILALTLISFSEGGGAVASRGKITRNTPSNTALTVTLTSSDTTEATVPATVTIPIGASSAVFNIAAVEDTIVDGPRRSAITASASGFVAARVVVTVNDNDGATAPVSAPPAASISSGATSPVVLSSIVAQAGTSRVRLTFSGSLDVNVATDVARYAVEAAGQSVIVESAAYDAASNSVTLGLAEGSLQSGQSVTAAWSDLRDTRGLSLSGQSKPVAAR